VFGRLALMLVAYSDLETPVVELMAPNGLVMARTSDGTLLVPLYLDWAMWTPPMSRFVDAVEASLPVHGARRMVVSGWLSSRARQRVEERGWDLLEGVEMTWLAEIDSASWRPGEPDPDRVLPEFGE
jgi:hypothetical protein